MIPQTRRAGPEKPGPLCYAEGMNFLAHLYLAGDDEALRLGALLGDFVRGRVALEIYPEPVREGIRMHRHIDAFIDTLPDFVRLRASLEPPFRRYAGIIIDLGLDHELARRWEDYSDQPLAAFDSGVRGMLARNADLVPDGLARFMRYADRHGLFATYAVPDQVMHSLHGIGRRLSRPNPLARVAEIWPEIQPRMATAFDPLLGAVQRELDEWSKSRSTMTGS
jgi:acyl carrier protein phosphodiesterase